MYGMSVEAAARALRTVQARTVILLSQDAPSDVLAELVRSRLTESHVAYTKRGVVQYTAVTLNADGLKAAALAMKLAGCAPL